MEIKIKLKVLFKFVPSVKNTIFLLNIFLDDIS